MKLLYINPNSTEAMTRSVVAAARAVLPQAEVSGWTNRSGPPAIQGPEDGAAAVPGLMAMLPQAQAEAVDVIVIACFDDTGLSELRAAAHCPVLGIGQSAYVMAGLLGARFSVVTTLAVSVPVIAGNIARLGITGCAAVRPSGLPVLAVDEGHEETRRVLAQHIATAAAEDGVDVVVLGCAGMAALEADMAARTGVRLVDGVAASARLAGAIAGMSAPR